MDSSHSSHTSHEHGSDMTSTMDTMDMEGHEHFCNGDGTVMLMGFQAATSASVNCILFLFEGAGVDTKTKYVFAAMGAFFMGLTNEMIRYGRARMSKELDVSFTSDVKMSLGFAVQVFLAYMLMLLVMLYEYVILIMIILGLGAGHFLTLRLSAADRQKALQNGTKSTPEVAGSSGSPCCNTDIVA